MKYLTVGDLMKRYKVLARSTITSWVYIEKLPRPDKIGQFGRHEWSEKTITDWERTHGGNTEMFKVYLRSHDITFDSFLARNPDYAKIIKSLQKNSDSQQIEFSEPELIPESNSSSDGERCINEVLDSFNLAAPEANNPILDDSAASSSRVIAFMNELATLRDSVHALIKIVSILTNAQRNSSGLLYGQIKAALIPLEALEKEFNIDEPSPFTKPGE